MMVIDVTVTREHPYLVFSVYLDTLERKKVSPYLEIRRLRPSPFEASLLLEPGRASHPKQGQSQRI